MVTPEGVPSENSRNQALTVLGLDSASQRWPQSAAARKSGPRIEIERHVAEHKEGQPDTRNLPPAPRLQAPGVGARRGRFPS